jgi:hypothetical protein
MAPTELVVTLLYWDSTNSLFQVGRRDLQNKLDQLKVDFV